MNYLVTQKAKQNLFLHFVILQHTILIYRCYGWHIVVFNSKYIEYIKYRQQSVLVSALLELICCFVYIVAFQLCIGTNIIEFIVVHVKFLTAYHFLRARLCSKCHWSITSLYILHTLYRMTPQSTIYHTHAHYSYDTAFSFI